MPNPSPLNPPARRLAQIRLALADREIPDEIAVRMAAMPEMSADHATRIAPTVRSMVLMFDRHNIPAENRAEWTGEFLQAAADTAFADPERALMPVREKLLDHLADQSEKQMGRTVEIAPDNGMSRIAQMRAGMIAAIVAHVRGEKNPPPEARPFMSAITWADVAAECLRAAGQSVPMGGPGRVIGAALGGRQGFDPQRAGVAYQGSSDFPAVLSGAFGALQLREYDAATSGLLRAALPRDVPNFMPVKAAALGGDLKLLQVPEHAEITYGHLEDSGETLAVASYARIVALTRQALVNDQLGAFDRLPRMLATGAAETVASVLVGLLEAGSGAGPLMADGQRLFHSSRGNIMTAGGITVANIGLAVAALRRQRGLAGEAISIEPAFIIVPPELEAAALQAVAEISPATASDANPFAGRLEVVVEPRLVSATRWYVASAPGRPESLVAAHLEGNRAPMLDSRQGFEVDGMEFRCRLDFGAAFLDWRGWITNPGA